MKKRALIASGGTGGHFYPGFALAQELRRRGWQVLFLVKREDIARPALDEADFPYEELDMVALPRSLNPLAHASFLLKFVKSLALARRIMADYRPDAVLGTGSYIAFPAALAARLAGVPVFLHESNAVLGLGNRLAGLFCLKTALGLPLAGSAAGEKAVLTGTPIREAFAAAPDKARVRAALGLDPVKFTVLVFGGSQGARRLNAAFAHAARYLKGDIQALHIAGRRDFEAVRAAYDAAGLTGARGMKLFDYCEDMQEMYAAADAVVARSGASTIAELAHLRKPSVLVPLPSSAGGHQKANAAALAARGAAECVEEGPDFDMRLEAALRRFLDEPDRLEAMRARFAAAGIPDGLKAASALADLIEETTAPEASWK